MNYYISSSFFLSTNMNVVFRYKWDCNSFFDHFWQFNEKWTRNIVCGRKLLLVLVWHSRTVIEWIFLKQSCLLSSYSVLSHSFPLKWQSLMLDYKSHLDVKQTPTRWRLHCALLMDCPNSNFLCNASKFSHAFVLEF
jgi:hypothetical protein